MLRGLKLSVLLILLSICTLQAYAQTTSSSGLNDYGKIALVNISQIQTFEQLLTLDHYIFSKEGPPPYDPVNPLGLAEESKDRIILAGDSWAAFPCGFKSMEKALSAVKSELKNDWRCQDTAKLGLRAYEWLGSSEDEALTEILKTDKRVKYVYLSLGGNDVLDEWHVSMTSLRERELISRVAAYLKSITTKYLALRPDLKIIISGYDYPHFKQNHAIPLYRKIYASMGYPSPAQINSALIGFSQYLNSQVDHKNVFYIHHLGLAQYYDGLPPDIMAPESTLPPSQISSFDHPDTVGGFPSAASSETSMMVWLKMFSDAFHLTEGNYLYVMLHTYNNVLVPLQNKN